MALMLSVQTSSADEDDLIDLKGGFHKKVIVSSDEAKLFTDGPGVGDGKVVKAFSIYFALKGSEGDYVRVGDGDGMEIGWISENAVIEWNTRLLLQPKTPDPATPDAVFRVISPGATATFTGAVGSDKQKAAAPILEKVDEGKNPDYKIAYFAGNSTAVGAKKAPVGASTTSSKRRKVEIVFVIDTTASMTPLLQGAKDVAVDVAALLAGSGEAEAAVKFGLVQYRDSTDGITFDGEPARLETALTDAATFRKTVNSLSVTPLGSEETAEDVLAGLLEAIENAGWSTNSSKHIVLLGDASAHLDGPKNTTGETIETIIGKAQSTGGSELVTKLGTIMFHAVKAKNIDVADGILCTEQFKTFAANAGQRAGFFADFDPSIASEKKATIEELHEFLGAFVKGISLVRSGKVATLKVAASGKGPAAIPAKVLYDLEIVAGGPEIKTIESGTAKLRSDDGDLLARQMVMVSETDLRRLRSSLDLLEVSLGKLRDPSKRKDVGKLLKVLKQTLILNLGGEGDFDETTDLAGFISNLPLRTDVLNTSALDLQKKNAESYQKWIDDLVAAKKRTNSLLEDEGTDWHVLSEEAANAKFAYILMDEMP
jgi:hypothetical protein